MKEIFSKVFRSISGAISPGVNELNDALGVLNTRSGQIHSLGDHNEFIRLINNGVKPDITTLHRLLKLCSIMDNEEVIKLLKVIVKHVKPTEDSLRLAVETFEPSVVQSFIISTGFVVTPAFVRETEEVFKKNLKNLQHIVGCIEENNLIPILNILKDASNKPKIIEEEKEEEKVGKISQTLYQFAEVKKVTFFSKLSGELNVKISAMTADSHILCEECALDVAGKNYGPKSS